MTIKQRVRAGIRFFDRTYPRLVWRPKIKLKSLDLGHKRSCILGQTDTDFDSHALKLRLTCYRAYKFGFHAFRDGLHHTRISEKNIWDRLTAAWKEELRKI